MNSTLLVFLSLVAGAAAGAGFAVLAMPARHPAPVPPVPVVAPLAPAEAPPGKTDDAPSEEYVRLAEALIALDERMSEISTRDENAQSKVDALLDNVRELALQLEIRSGKLQPMNTRRVEPVVPMPVRDAPMPLRDKASPGVTEDGMPRW